MSERRRRAAPAALIAAADIMACFVGILLVVLVESKVKVEAEVKELENRKVELRSEVAGQERKFDEMVRELEAEREKKEAKIQAEIVKQEARLEQKKQNFRDWDWVVNRLRVSQGMSRLPDTHLYLRASGIYRDGSKQAMTDEQVLAFLRAEAEAAPTRSDGKAYVAMWQENGANDQYIRVLDIKDRFPELNREVEVFTIILQSGVRAGPERKGNEPLEKKEEGR